MNRVFSLSLLHKPQTRGRTVSAVGLSSRNGLPLELCLFPWRIISLCFFPSNTYRLFFLVVLELGMPLSSCPEGVLYKCSMFFLAMLELGALLSSNLEEALYKST